MVRALIQSGGVAPATLGPLVRRRGRAGPPIAFPAIGGTPAATSASPGHLRPGYGLLIAAGASLGLWAGLAKLALSFLR